MSFNETARAEAVRRRGELALALYFGGGACVSSSILWPETVGALLWLGLGLLAGVVPAVILTVQAGVRAD